MRMEIFWKENGRKIVIVKVLLSFSIRLQHVICYLLFSFVFPKKESFPSLMGIFMKEVGRMV